MQTPVLSIMLIYKIISKNSDLVYVGRTTQTINVRMIGHRVQYKRYLAGKQHYISSFKVLECGDCSIELIEETEDDTRERFWIRELNACNQITYDFDKAAYLKDYRETNREALAEQQRAYREANRDTINEKNRERGKKKITCSNCGKFVSRPNMWKHKKRKICMNHSNTYLSD